MDSATAALAQAAQEVTDAAREVKRAHGHARRCTRELLQRLQELEQACARQGITFTINAQPEEGHGVRSDADR